MITDYNEDIYRTRNASFQRNNHNAKTKIELKVSNVKFQRTYQIGSVAMNCLARIKLFPLLSKYNIS